MRFQVKLFAVARQLAGREVAEVELAEGATVGQLRVALAQQYPELTETLERAVFAVNQEYADDQTTVPSDAEVACIPPVSGGA